MKFELLGLYAETSIHAGAGTSTGVIDLPIMREAHTGWPCVFGSAVKGALRCKAEQVGLDSLVDVFGPDTKNASDHAGALAVGDARLLLLPVRSLTSHFKWVTCPSLLKRASDDAKRMGKKVADFKLAAIKADSALQATESGALYLEEFHFKAEKCTELTAIIQWLAGFVPSEADFAERLEQQLVIVHDDLFAHLAQYATPVTPHIAIDNKTKTVVGGALWYEETLPAETVMYLALAASASRKRSGDVSADQVLAQTLSLFPETAPYLQLGGNETVGMGWCRVSAVKEA